jgi:hypothetical protein
MVLGGSVSGRSRPKDRIRRRWADGKRNPRPVPKTEEELKKEAREQSGPKRKRKRVEEPGVATVETNIVNVDAVVFNKKTGQIITGLKKENFAIFENGVKQNISNSRTPERSDHRFAGRSSTASGLNITDRRTVVISSRAFMNPSDRSRYSFRNSSSRLMITRLSSHSISDRRQSPILRTTRIGSGRRSTFFLETLLRSARTIFTTRLNSTLLGGRGDAVVLDKSTSRTA